MKYVDCSELALKKVKINGDIIGKFGKFDVEQTFKNNTLSVLEVGYTFPITETATVVGFEIRIGEKVLKATCKESETAKKEYTTHIIKGDSAYLLEEQSPNIFRITVGKLNKKEEVTIKISYIDKFEIVDNKINILVPTLVYPKYQSLITKLLRYGDAKYTADIDISIHKNIDCKSIFCPSHKINLCETDDGKLVKVRNTDLSKDFKLSIELKNELMSNALVYKAENRDILHLSFIPEITESYEDNEKEYLFLVDISGSMDGKKLEETKRAVIKCLKQLDVGDKFNIIPFESTFTAMSVNSLEYNEENLKKAIKYINELTACGGTEIFAPINFALYEKDSRKIVLLFTDGQVGNEKELLRFVHENIGNSRLFPFGIDNNVNTYFIKELAKVGFGKAELIQPDEPIDEKILRTFARIQTPLLEDIKINYGNNKLSDEIREDESLFNYEFYNVFAVIDELQGDIVLSGKIDNQELS